MNLQALVKRTRDLTLVIADEFSDTEVQAFINEGLQLVAAAHRWPWCQRTTTITTVGGKAEYTLPSGYLQIEAVIPQADQPSPAHVSVLEAHRRFSVNATAQWAEAFTVTEQTKLTLFPTPSVSGNKYTVFYQAAPNALTSSSSPPFAEAFHQILSDYAAAQMFRREEMRAEYADAMNAFELGLTRMRSFYDNQVADNSRRLYGARPTWRRTGTTRR